MASSNGSGATATFLGLSWAYSSLMAETIFLICAWPNSRASATASSETSRAPDSTMTMASGALEVNVHQTFLLVGDGGIDHQLPVNQANADAGDGLLEREVRTVGRSRRAGHSDDVRIIFAVRGEHHGDDLRFVAPGFREERAHGAVNQAGGENFLLRGAAFTLEEAAGDFSGRVGVLAIVHGEGKEVAVIGGGSHASRSEHDGIAIARHNGAVGLFGNFPSFESESAAADIHRDAMGCGSMCIFRHESFPLAPTESGHVEARSTKQTGLELTLTAARPSMRKSKRREESLGERNATDYTTRISGTNSAGCLTTDSVWNVSIRENAVDTALIPMEMQDDYLRRLRRSTISRYRSGSRRLR